VEREVGGVPVGQEDSGSRASGGGGCLRAVAITKRATPLPRGRGKGVVGPVEAKQSLLDVLGDPCHQFLGADLPGSDTDHHRDDLVGVFQGPSPAIDDDESPHGGVGCTLVPVGQRVVLDKVFEQDGGLLLERWIELDAAERRLGRRESRIGQADARALGQCLAVDTEGDLRDRELVPKAQILRHS